MFLETFHDEPPLVQLQLLTATVKLFLRRPDSGQELVTHVLGMATEQSDNPDLRDRGYVYWRLLASAPSVAKVRWWCFRVCVSCVCRFCCCCCTLTNVCPPHETSPLLTWLSCTRRLC